MVRFIAKRNGSKYVIDDAMGLRWYECIKNSILVCLRGDFSLKSREELYKGKTNQRICSTDYEATEWGEIVTLRREPLNISLQTKR